MLFLFISSKDILLFNQSEFRFNKMSDEIKEGLAFFSYIVTKILYRQIYNFIFYDPNLIS